MNHAWSGRFDEGPAEEMLAFSESLAEDRILLRHDVAGSIAHARGLEHAGLLNAEEAREMEEGLRRVLEKLTTGEAELRVEHEDVHMNVEVLLHEEIGPLAGKLHAGRSRNDQVALDVRLWTREALLGLAANLFQLQWDLLVKARDHLGLAFPGYTHLQPAQPVTFGHWLHAHAERFGRDAERVLSSFDRTNVSPLGAAALGGTSFPIDPAYTARELGFDSTFNNSLDAVSDRDFAAEALFAAALAGVHVSQLSEELIRWSAPEYGFIELPEAYTTGSSIMPQKRNPDAAEIARGRAGRAVGALVDLLTTLKGLPTAYNRDLQETKPPLMRTLPATAECARILSRLVRGLTAKPPRMWDALERGHLAATELADLMATRGVPFREAHHAVGALVKEADARDVRLSELPLEVLREHWPGFEEADRMLLDPSRVPDRKVTPGGTGPELVRDAVNVALSNLKVQRGEFEARLAKVKRVDALIGDAE